MVLLVFGYLGLQALEIFSGFGHRGMLLDRGSGCILSPLPDLRFSLYDLHIGQPLSQS